MEVILRAAIGDGESWIFIVPNRIAERRLERKILEASEGRALARMNILTLADLAGKLASAALPHHRYIADSESAMLMELSIRELLAEKKLAFFDRAVTPSQSAFPVPRGTFELIINTIRQLKETGIAPIDIQNDLVETSLKAESTQVERAKDILRIYERYHSFLDKRKLMDTYGQTLLVNEWYASKDHSINREFHSSFPNVTDIFISGFYYLEPPSIALIARLGEISGIAVGIELAENKNNPNLFSGLIDLESRLKKSGFNIPSSVRHPEHPVAEHAASRLFQLSNDPNARKAESSIQYLAAYDPLAEIEEIAKQIKVLYKSALEEGAIKLSDFVLATPSPETYTPLIEEVFREHEIPVQITDRHHLDRSPLVQGILSIVEAARSGIRRRELVRMLLSPYFDFSAACGEMDIPSLLDILARHTDNSTLLSMERSLELEIREAEVRRDASEDSQEFARVEAQMFRLQNALHDLKKTSQVLKPLMQELSVQEFCDRLRTLLRALRLQENIVSSSAVMLRMGVLEMDARALQVTWRLLEELGELFGSMGQAEKKHPVQFYEQRLKAALAISRYSTRTRTDAVLVTSLAQSISQPARYLFLAGLSEEAFPALYQPQVFLTQSLQKGERRQLLEDRVLFYQAITNYTSKLYLSTPSKTLSGATLNRSSVLEALDEIFEIGTAKSPEGIFSKRDLYTAFSRYREMPSWNDTRVPESWRSPLGEQVPEGRTATAARLSMELSIYRGNVTADLLTEQERRSLEYNKSRIWSITQLERYANCHFRFFAQDILGLREEVAVKDGVDALERGSALHEVFRELLSSRREQKTIQDTPESELQEVNSQAREIAQNYFFSKSKSDPFWRIDAEHLIGDHNKEGGLLQKFIEKEYERREYELRPRFFEVSFGGFGRASKSPIDPELSSQEPVEIGGFKLRGKIDRIDISKDHQADDDQPGHFAVIDYKSGKTTPSRSKIERGLSLQLPLYLKVAEDLLRTHYPELKGVAALYHKVLDSESERKLGLALKEFAGTVFEKLKGRDGLIKTESELEELIEQTVRKAKGYVDGVASGQFPLVESDLTQACSYCPYNTVCRIQEAIQADVLV